MTEHEQLKEEFANWKAPESSGLVNNSELEKKIVIKSYLDAVSVDELKNRVLVALDDIKDPKELAFKLKDLGVSDATDRQVLEQAISTRIEQYQQRLERIREFVPKQIEIIHAWLSKQDLRPQQNPEDVPVYVSDPILHLGAGEDFKTISGELFDIKQNAISISGNEDDNILAHEYFHAMSHDPNTGEVGFSFPKEGELRKNLWLDEGATMIGEFATHPTKEPNKRDKPDHDHIYGDGFYWLTQVYIKELGISETELLRTYFHNQPNRTNLEIKTQERFGCSIEQLKDIFFGSSPEAKEQTMKIIKREPVTLEAMEGSGLDESYNRLAQIFPFIKVVITPRPKF